MLYALRQTQGLVWAITPLWVYTLRTTRLGRLQPHVHQPVCLTNCSTLQNSACLLGYWLSCLNGLLERWYKSVVFLNTISLGPLMYPLMRIETVHLSCVRTWFSILDIYLYWHIQFIIYGTIINADTFSNYYHWCIQYSITTRYASTIFVNTFKGIFLSTFCIIATLVLP